jgi:porin
MIRFQVGISKHERLVTITETQSSDKDRRQRKTSSRLVRFHFVLISGLALAIQSFAQDAVTISKTKRSIFQPEMEVAVQPGGFRKADYMTGDWGGYRERLQHAGVEVFGLYNSIFSGNVSGGIHPHHATYVDDAWLGVKFDFDKLVGWRGGQFVVSGINRDGDDLTGKYIGSIYSTQQMVGGQRPFLYQVYLQQKFWDDCLTAKVGRFGASDDFNSSPLYGYSLNNGIDGNIRNVLFDTRFSAYPFAVWAAALFYEPAPEWRAKVGLFQTSKDMFENDDHGVNWDIGGSDGYTLIGQFGWSPQFFKQAVSVPLTNEKNVIARTNNATATPATKGLPGHYWFGFTYSQWDLYQRFDGGFEDHSYGFYAHADQMIYQEAPGSDEGLIAFLASGYYPQKEISIVPFQLNAGLNYKGLFPRRHDDRTMLHFIYGDISPDYSRSVHIPGGGTAEAEEVVEFAHRFQVTPWSYFQPDIQYVINPGGTGDIPDAVVIGAQMGVTF